MARTLQGMKLVFEAPEGWSEERFEKRLDLHGPEGEVLQVSGFNVSAAGTVEQRLSVLNSVTENCLQAARRAAADPALSPLMQLSLTVDKPDERRWDGVSTADNGTSIFAYSVFSGSDGVMLITLEGPCRPETMTTFRMVIESIRSR